MGLWDDFADPALARRLHEAYRGRHGVSDAVWWRDHPSTPGPSGAEPPAAEVTRLAKLVFARGGASDDIVAKHRAAVDALEKDRIDLDAAVVEARGTPATAAVEQEQEQEQEPPAARNRWVLAAGAAVVALILGVGLGTSLASSRTEGSTPDAAIPSATATPVAIPIFDRPRVDSGELSDVPDLELGSDSAGYIAESFRFIQPIASADASDLNSEFAIAATVYAARTTSNRACLVAVADKRVIGSACAVEKEFPVNGVQLAFTLDDWLYQVSWRRDGLIGDGYSATQN